MLHSHGFIHFLDTARGDTQVDVAVDGEVEVGQLRTVATVVEDEVLVQAGVGSTHIEVLPYDAALLPGACRVHARPVAVEVVHISPLVEVEVPTRLVDHIHHETVVFNSRFVISALVVAFPALSPDISKGTYGRVVVVYGLHSLDGIFHALSGRIEAEAVGQCLATDISVRVDIYTPFHVALGGFGEEVGRIANCGAVSVESTDDIDFLVNRCSEGSDELEEDAVGTCLELLAFVVEHDVIVA